MKTATRVSVGQIWERYDGSTFKIEKIKDGSAFYWLNAGSRPQFRSVRIDRLTGASRNYRLTTEDTPNAPRT